MLEQESEKTPSETQENPESVHAPGKSHSALLSEAPENASTQQPASEPNAEACESVTPTTTATGAATTNPQPQQVVPAAESPTDAHSRVYTLPDAFRGVRSDLYPGYGSLSRFSLHGYLPTKNFQPGAHYTLPFLRDSYTPTCMSNQTEEDRENLLDKKSDDSAAGYQTLGGIHQFRPITTMELFREPSRTR